MTNADDRWKACPRGELSRLGDRLRGRRRRRSALRAGSVLAVLVTCVGLWALNARPRDNTFAGISCTRVMELAMAYRQGTLAPDLSRQVRTHVEQCPPCHKRFDEMGLLSRRNPERWGHLVKVAVHAATETPHEQEHSPAAG